MNITKTKETYLFTDIDPINKKENKIELTIDYSRSEIDFYIAKKSENSDIIEQIKKFAKEKLTEYAKNNGTSN